MDVSARPDGRVSILTRTYNARVGVVKGGGLAIKEEWLHQDLGIVNRMPSLGEKFLIGEIINGTHEKKKYSDKTM